ncbi:MAG: FMN-binding negative transcriptional regulator [Phycisphaeraceae bacterium]
MTTAQPLRKKPSAPPPINAVSREIDGEPALERQAVRFLIAHRLGRLMTFDPVTDEPWVTPVHYVLGSDGALVTHLPAGAEHVQAIRRGGASLLSVYTRNAYVPDQLRDDDGQPTARAVRQVQAEVDTRIIDSPDQVADVLRRQVASVLRAIGQESEGDEAARAPLSTLEQLVVVKMDIENVRVRLHESLDAA